VTDHLSKATLSTKQVDVSALGEVERHALSTTLLAYGLGHDPDEVERGRSELRDLFGGLVEQEFDPTRTRRFAGDRTLPRSRYSSLLDDVLADHKTLLQEMSAYLGQSTYPGLVSLFETEGANALELLAILAAIPKRNYRALDLGVPSLLIALRPLDRDAVLHDAYGPGCHYVVQIPYVVSTEEIRDVIDLRRPAARTWLVEQFHRSVQLEDEFPVLLHRQPPVDFAQLLPSLLDQWLGGGWSTGNMAGFFARSAGGRGLVYPSARSNAWVEVERRVVKGSSGWCFVRYEGAPQMETTLQVSIASDEWPETAGFAPDTYSWVREFIPVKGVAIAYEREGSRAGSFSVTGLAEYNRAVYRLAQVSAVLKAIDAKLGASVSSRLTQMALYSAGEDVAWLASVVMGALLGDASSVAALETATLSAGSDHERETLMDTRTLVTRSPRTFQATGTLAEALRLGRF
jgi:hypothetical protein